LEQFMNYFRNILRNLCPQSKIEEIKIPPEKASDRFLFHIECSPSCM
jgi:hypothetical protein